jgi:cold shock CspA family protein
MARSQETFNKKENESKKLKKQKEKVLRKQERKANSSKGGGLESMMAYVDENGHIVSEPVDLSQRKEINEEDIQIGVPKREDLGPAEPNTGKVTFFNDSKGYGFIKDSDTQENYFVHINGCVDQIKENDRVSYDLAKGQKGLNAVNVRIIPKAAK